MKLKSIDFQFHKLSGNVKSKWRLSSNTTLVCNSNIVCHDYNYITREEIKRLIRLKLLPLTSNITFIGHHF